MAKRIVYHGTTTEEPPHKHGYPFHAGSRKAAYDRLDDEVNNGFYWEDDEPEVLVGQVHAYEISDKAPTSRRTWEDPDFHDVSKSVPEHKENRIYPYTNKYEDKGSTSYVVPSKFVGNHVKHLSTEQFFINTTNEQDDTVYNTMSTMVGGKRTNK